MATLAKRIWRFGMWRHRDITMRNVRTKTNGVVIKTCWLPVDNTICTIISKYEAIRNYMGLVCSWFQKHTHRTDTNTICEPIICVRMPSLGLWDCDSWQYNYVFGYCLQAAFNWYTFHVWNARHRYTGAVIACQFRILFTSNQSFVMQFANCRRLGAQRI